MNSKDFFGKFSFQDILGYFLPGIAVTLGFYVFLYQVELFPIPNIEPDIFTGILFFLISFTVGITLSGVSHPIVKFIYWLKKKDKPENSIPLKKSKDKLKQVLSSKLGLDSIEDWDEEYYIFCNIMVKELLPNSFVFSYRQESLRIMRTYMMFPTLLWTINGITYGIHQWSISPFKGVFLIVISTLVGGMLLLNIWNRMYKNRQRMVTNILASFICLDKISEEKRIEKNI
ncbi:MAG: hypothetical protein DHS20C18_21780 [Saprospiraceae bacterium]|nr:MAG: hypothetical protein DHS20C18_21780 [Saprospiraceae bacterium]